MNSNLRTLGPSEAKVILSFREQDRSVVCTSDVLAILGSKNLVRAAIRSLVRKGWLTRIVGGRYMLLPPEYGPENLGENNILALAAAAIEPSYIGWWSAAAYHGFTTQKPAVVFVAVLKQNTPKIIEGSEVRFVTVTPRKFFGSKTYDVYGRDVSISSPAKTFVDCLDRPDLCGGASELARIAHSALEVIDPQELLEAAMAMKSKSVLQRLGFIADLVDRPLPGDIRQTIRQGIPKTYRSHFGRDETREGDIGYVAAWGLFVNARQEDLLTEVPHIKSREIH